MTSNRLDASNQGKGGMPWEALLLPGAFLDSNDRRPRIGLALLAGAGLGLIWGVAARIWMALLTDKPEFSISGTAVILVGAILVGLGASFALAARRRQWKRALILPRALAVLLFIGVAGGPGSVGFVLPVLTGTLGICRRSWPRVLRAALILISIAVVVRMSWEIVSDKPGWPAPINVLFYMALLYPLFLAMRTGLEPITPRRSTGQEQSDGILDSEEKSRAVA